tara:strand:+ start:7721 stop:8569 length:849 start_codon:yes stop_codon:yes gene_type:complete
MDWMKAKGLFFEKMSSIYDQNELRSLYKFFLQDYMDVNPYIHVYTPKKELNALQIKKFHEGLSSLNRCTPIQYLTEQAFFYDLSFKVNSSVLIPRSETEELVRLIYSKNQNRKSAELQILDLGTGSGCIAIALKSKFQNAFIVGVDISQKALDIANYNAVSHGYSIDFEQCDMRNFNSAQKFDIIVSNPPYVLELEKNLMHSNVLYFEPETALFVPDADPLKYYKAMVQSINFGNLKTRSLFLEINPKCLDQLIDLVKPLGDIEIHQDLNDKKRFIEVNIRE